MRFARCPTATFFILVHGMGSVPIEVGSSGNPNFIEVRHGRMLISVPRAIFKGRTSTLKEPEASEFRKILAKRYPWLTGNAIEVVMVEAQTTMESIIDMERGPVERARKLREQGRSAEALVLLEEHLEMEGTDPDAWYLKGEILFDLGNKDEGFRAFARARGRTRAGKP